MGFSFGSPSPLSGSQWVRRSRFSWERRMPRTAGKGVLRFPTPKSTHHAKKRAIETKAEIHPSWSAANGGLRDGGLSKSEDI